MTIILLIVAALSILSKDEWGHLECLYKPKAIFDGGLLQTQP